MKLKSQMQYKLSFFLTILGQFLISFGTFFGLEFIFQSISKVDEYSYSEVLMCFAVISMSFSIGEMFGGGLAVFPNMIREGSFDRVMVRLRSIILQIAAPNTDFSKLV